MRMIVTIAVWTQTLTYYFTVTTLFLSKITYFIALLYHHAEAVSFDSYPSLCTIAVIVIIAIVWTRLNGRTELIYRIIYSDE